MSFYTFARFVVNVYSHIVYRLKFEGMENIPAEGGFILCSSHITQLDPIMVAERLKHQCFFMAKEELFKNKLVSALLRALGAFPVSRGTGDTAAIDRAVEIVKNGQVLAIFPEGTRSKTGKLQKLKSGVVVVAAQTGADILPCIVKMGKRKWLRRSFTVSYGPVIQNAELGLSAGDASPSALKNAKRVLTQRMEAQWEATNG